MNCRIGKISRCRVEGRKPAGVVYSVEARARLCLIEGISSLDIGNSVARDGTDQLYQNFRVLLLFIQIGR